MESFFEGYKAVENPMVRHGTNLIESKLGLVIC